MNEPQHTDDCATGARIERDALRVNVACLRSARAADEDLLTRAEEFIKAVEPKMSICSHCQLAISVDDSGFLREHTLTCAANPLVQQLAEVTTERDRLRAAWRDLAASYRAARLAMAHVSAVRKFADDAGQIIASMATNGSSSGGKTGGG